MHNNYYCAGGYEVIDVIEAFNLNFNRGNAAKYIFRAGRKSSNELEDLRKAKDYIEREINRLQDNGNLTRLAEYINNE